MEQLQFSSLLRQSDILMKQAKNWCLFRLDYHLAINNVYCEHLKGRLGVYLEIVRTFFGCYMNFGPVTKVLIDPCFHGSLYKMLYILLGAWS